MDEKKNYRFASRPQKASDLLKGLLKQYGLAEKISKYNFVLHWEEIVGADLAKVCKPYSLENKILTIAVPNSIWAQELSFQKTVIRNRLNYFFKEQNENIDLVKDVKFKIVNED